MLVHQLFYGILCQIRVDRTGSVAEERRKMVYLTRLAGLQDHGNRRSLFRLYQMLLQR